MSVICFSSLKGGVGKTSVSVNVAHAFARRGCTTLLIDLDPAGHATRLFYRPEAAHLFPLQAPIARTLLSGGGAHGDFSTSADPREADGSVAFIVPVREGLDLLPGGEDLHHFTPAQGAQRFARGFPMMLRELERHYDHVVIDTPPDFGCLVRTALGVSDLVVVPVDASEMGAHSAEHLILSARHLKRPTWALVCTMVDQRSDTVRFLSASRLRSTLAAFSTELPAITAETFLSRMEGWQRTWVAPGGAPGEPRIALLESCIYRFEQQNQLSFLKKTALDSRRSHALTRQYLALTREIEDILAITDRAKEAPSQTREPAGAKGRDFGG